MTAKTGRAVEVDVPLEQKIYHKPVLKKSADASTPDVLEHVDEAQLGGQKYAYNGRDYHFRVKAARGYRITEYPTEAYVYVNDTLIFEDPITPDANRQFTIFGSELTHTLHPELAALDKATLDALALSNTDYADWTGSTQPNSDGYRGYNIDIRFDRFATEELEYIVEGVTNDGGYVTYAKDDGEDDCDITETDEKDPREYIMVQTRNSKNALGGPNHNTGTFTFTGNGDNIVERVFINGLEVDTYNDLHSFTYTFGEVDMDNNITVLFWDGEHPSTDKVMTIVVGDYGFADVTSPVAATGDDALMCTRRTYLNPTGNLVFTTRPAGDAYKLYKVERELEGEPRENVTNSNPDYEDLEDVEEWDFPTLEDSATYRYDKLMESMAFGAIFVEKTYKVEGYIDLGQRSNLSDAIGPRTGATVTFVRLNADGTEKAKQVPFKTVSTAARHDSTFTIDLPAGKWNVYVTKQGYVTYEITGFELTAPDPEDKVTYFANKQTVVPFIGSTREGKMITLQDAANVKSGLRPGVNLTVYNQADVDNDGQTLALDLAYVWHNFNECVIIQEYSDFEARGSYMVDEATNP